jgi:hypothetical protein
VSHPDDDELRDLFARSRSEDRQRAGDFAALIATASSGRARARAPSWRAVTVVAAASIAVAYVALREWPTSHGSGEEAPMLALDPRSTRWESPTDFLLATPGDAMLRTLPTFRYTSPDLPGDPSLTPQPGDTSPGRPARRIDS